MPAGVLFSLKKKTQTGFGVWFVTCRSFYGKGEVRKGSGDVTEKASGTAEGREPLQVFTLHTEAKAGTRCLWDWRFLLVGLREPECFFTRTDNGVCAARMR